MTEIINSAARNGELGSDSIILNQVGIVVPKKNNWHKQVADTLEVPTICFHDNIC